MRAARDVSPEWCRSRLRRNSSVCATIWPRCNHTCSMCGGAAETTRCDGSGFRRTLDPQYKCKLESLWHAMSTDAAILNIMFHCFCPQRCNNEQPLAIDGGTSNARLDVVGWHRRFTRWRSVSLEALPSNCGFASRQLEKFGARARFVCKALSDHVGYATLRMGGNES